MSSGWPTIASVATGSTAEMSAPNTIASPGVTSTWSQPSWLTPMSSPPSAKVAITVPSTANSRIGERLARKSRRFSV